MGGETVYERADRGRAHRALPSRGRRRGRRARSSATAARWRSSPRRRARVARAPAARGGEGARPAGDPGGAPRRGGRGSRCRPRSASWPRRSGAARASGSRSSSYYTSAGFTDERVHLFHATGSVRGAARRARRTSASRSFRGRWPSSTHAIAECARRQDADRPAVAGASAERLIAPSRSPRAAAKAEGMTRADAGIAADRDSAGSSR